MGGEHACKGQCCCDEDAEGDHVNLQFELRWRWLLNLLAMMACERAGSLRSKKTLSRGAAPESGELLWTLYMSRNRPVSRQRAAISILRCVAGRRRGSSACPGTTSSLPLKRHSGLFVACPARRLLRCGNRVTRRSRRSRSELPSHLSFQRWPASNPWTASARPSPPALSWKRLNSSLSRALSPCGLAVLDNRLVS